MDKLLQGQDLLQKAEELGVDTQGELITQSACGRRKADEATLQKRVNNAETHIRQGRLWIITIISTVIALVSALGSLVSALCAYYALHHALH